MATALQATNLFVTMQEKVADDLDEAFESADSLAAMFKSKVTKTVETSDKLYRNPIKLARGAAYGAFDAEGGAMGRGTGGEYEEFLFSRFYTKIVVEWTYKADKSTNSSDKAKVKAAEVITDAVDELQVLADIEAHGDGRGLLVHSVGANTATADDGGVTSYVFDYPTDTLGAVNLRRKLYCRVFNNAGTTMRWNTAAGATVPFVITKVDLDIDKVWLDKQVTSTSPAQFDILVFDGVNANITKNANYSGTPPLFPDSWRHGVKFYNDAAQSGYMGGLQKSAVPEVLANAKNGTGSYCSQLLIQSGLDKVYKKRDDKTRSQLLGIMSLADKYALIEKYVDITSWQRTKQMEEALDLVPANLQSPDSVFTLCGVTHMISKRQEGGRLDYVLPKKWGRNVGFPTQWYTGADGNKIFPAYSTDGGISAAFIAYMVQSFDYFCTDPGRQLYIYGMSRPEGY